MSRGTDDAVIGRAIATAVEKVLLRSWGTMEAYGSRAARRDWYAMARHCVATLPVASPAVVIATQNALELIDRVQREDSLLKGAS